MKPNTITIDEVQYIRADSVPQVKPAGKEVIVRTFSAGVHIGQLKEQKGTEVVLTDARRLWKWAGAFTLNEVSQGNFTREGSRISASVPEIKLLEAIEIIPVAADANLKPTEK